MRSKGQVRKNIENCIRAAIVVTIPPPPWVEPRHETISQAGEKQWSVHVNS